MEAIHVTVTLSWPEATEIFESLFLVDTGATDSMAPGSQLIKAGFKPVGKTTYELANGQPVEYEFTLATIAFMGEITSGRVICGPDEAEPILGVTALESVGIVIDPVNRTLKRLPAIPLKSMSSGRFGVLKYKIGGWTVSSSCVTMNIHELLSCYNWSSCHK